MWLGKHMHLNWELDMLLIDYEYHSDLISTPTNAHTYIFLH